MQVQLKEGILCGIGSQFLVEGDEGETLDEPDAVLSDEGFVRECIRPSVLPALLALHNDNVCRRLLGLQGVTAACWMRPRIGWTSPSARAVADTLAGAVPDDALNPNPPMVDKDSMTDSIDSNAPRTFMPTLFCRECNSPLIQATDWQLEEESLWYVRLWCPECGFDQPAVLGHAQSTYLSMAIEEGFAQMLEALAQISAPTTASADLDLVHKAQTERIKRAGR
jgi:hypothetical protein